MPKNHSDEKEENLPAHPENAHQDDDSRRQSDSDPTAPPGRRVDDIMGKPFIQCIPEEYRGPVKEAIRQAQQTGAFRFSAEHYRHTEFHSDLDLPLPPPEILDGYSKIHQDLVPEFIDAWRSERTTRQRLEITKLEAQIDIENKKHSERTMGQRLGFFICIAALACAAFLGYRGHAAAAAIVGSTTVIGVSTIYILRRRYIGKTKEPVPIEEKSGEDES